MRRLLASVDDKGIKRLEWVLSFDEKKIQRFEKWDETLAWWGKTGRIGSGVLTFMLAALGAVATVKTVWDIFFPKGGH